MVTDLKPVRCEACHIDGQQVTMELIRLPVFGNCWVCENPTACRKRWEKQNELRVSVVS